MGSDFPRFNATRSTTTHAGPHSTGFTLVDRSEDAPEASNSLQERQELLETARQHIDKNEYAKAEEILKSVLSVKPNDPLCRSLLGRCHAEIDTNTLLAVPLCRAAAKDSRTPETLFQLGRVYVLTEDRKKAVKIFHEVLAMDPEHAPTLSELEELGRRSRPAIPFLPREHPLNVWLGRFRARRQG